MGIERKWLVTGQWPVEQVAYIEDIEESFIASDATAEVGVVRGTGLDLSPGNKIPEPYTQLTIDRQDSPTVRLNITPEIYNLIAKGVILAKVRFKWVLASEQLIAVDIFRQAGITLATVIFVDEASAEAFHALSWFGTEVTDDVAYTNAAILLRTPAPVPA